ncbi:HAD-superfamily hydrolase, subfamily IIB [Halothece sp. PCC 7418]|uniref:HAD family hydrolase n=1 Tax=Halothece sp. (strain PCC 7418) TaxID=65093 RepID=UPI0002A06508|nr:HAD family hydrolase [Halothece sp. PCC 7418]AFZ45619.1 HAD-superfamily hydrolase, subfamily IIB [Halothece sp. PCC 7418]
MKSLANLTRQDCKTVRLIATDFDGTVTENGQLTASAIQALARLQQFGIAVVIVTGRSAGWVNGLRHYLPVAGAIAENGGLYNSQPDTPPDILVSIPSLTQHRQNLAQVFQKLQVTFPHLQEATDNPFRFTDWTFDVAGLSESDLTQLQQQSQQEGYSFTYSSVQCHIKPQAQDKATGLKTVLSKYFSDLKPEEILTIGDSPNDESLFNPDLFPLSVGVANIQHYTQQLTHTPQYITAAAEGKGFCELANYLMSY